jgi:cobalamin biosynthesis protein CobT
MKILNRREEKQGLLMMLDGHPCRRVTASQQLLGSFESNRF